MAARVAAQLAESGVAVETKKGGLGEFSVDVDDRRVIDTNRFWYPTVKGIVGRVRTILAEQAEGEKE